MLMTLLNSVQSVLTIVIILAVGFAMARVGWIDDRAGNVFTKMILNVSLPCYMIWNLMSNFNASKLASLCGGLLIPALSMGLSFIAAIHLSNVLKVRENHKGVFRSVFFCSNTIFVGLPINLALFGEKSVPYVLLYYIVNTTFFWTIGVYQISRDGVSKEKVQFFSKSTLKRIFSPALMGFVVAIILILLRIQLPVSISDSCKYLGELTTPLAVIFIGLVMSTVRLKELRFNRELLFMLLGRFVFCPLLVFGLIHIIHVPALMGKVFVIQSAMPAMTNTSIVAKGYHADYKFATVATVLTTLASMVVIPLYMLIV